MAARWPSIRNDSTNWYVNNQAGVSIYRCAQSAGCTAADFGASPVVSDADVGGDGDAMPRLRRFWWIRWTMRNCWWEPAGCGAGRQTEAAGARGNAISAILDTGGHGGQLQRRRADPLHCGNRVAGRQERVYVGMYGSANGGGNLAGHVLSATVHPASGGMPVWQDLTLGPVTNNSNSLNKFGMDISSIFIDAHDPTGNTAYVTVEGAKNSPCR